MAKVFLSYDREDLATAKAVAAFLTEAGHSVWWDRHIRGGAQYSKEIERALEDSDAVVVLWSKASVNSEWVRDEAAEGRERGVLVPALLDTVKPPMGFRQYQTIDITDWNSQPSARAGQLLDALSAESPAVSCPQPKVTNRRPPKLKLSPRTFAAGAVVLALLIAALAWWRADRSYGPPTVSVTAADASGLSQSLARSLLVKLGVLQALSTHPIRIVDAAGDKADLNFTVNGTREDGQVRGSIALVSGSDGVILWSKDYDQPQTTQVELEAQIAISAGRVLDCAGEEASGESGRLSAGALRTFLNACAQISESGWDKRPVIPLLRQVLQEAPRFRPAWTKLVYAETEIVSYLIANEEPVDAAREQLRRDIAAARKVDPDMAEATLAELELGDRNSLTEVMALADKAIAQDPDNPTVLSARSMFLASAGRMRDSIADAQRAAELAPLSPANRNAYIIALAYGGQIDRARAELREAKKLWPGARAIDDAAYSIELRFGNFEKALREDDDEGPGISLYLTARRDPSDANIKALLDYVRSRSNRRGQAGFVLQALGEMNRPDEFFAFAEEANVAEYFGFDSYILFRPWIAPARRDPRFMRLAKDIGLVDYWQASGKWPDYCREPDLPYDCKAEAAKLSGNPG